MDKQPYQFKPKEIYRNVNEMCPVCHESQKDYEEKKKIVMYGMCSRCLYKRDFGKELPPRPSWRCQCGKEFANKKNLERHLNLKNHIAAGGIKSEQTKID